MKRILLLLSLLCILFSISDLFAQRTKTNQLVDGDSLYVYGMTDSTGYTAYFIGQKFVIGDTLSAIASILNIAADVKFLGTVTGVPLTGFADSLLNAFKFGPEEASPSLGDTLIVMKDGVKTRVDVGDMPAGSEDDPIFKSAFPDSLLNAFKFGPEDASPAAGDTLIMVKAGVKTRIDIGDLPAGGGGEDNTISSLGIGLSFVGSTPKSGVDLRVISGLATDFNLALDVLSLDYTNGQSAASGVKGYLIGADWDIFNNKQSALIFGIANTNVLLVDQIGAADNDFAKFTASGIEGRSFVEVRTDLGLVIGTNVQAWDADLDTWAGVTPSVNGQSLVTAANYAAMRALLDLEAGTDFYSISAADTEFLPRATFADSLLNAFKFGPEEASPSLGDTLIVMKDGVKTRVDVGDMPAGSEDDPIFKSAFPDSLLNAFKFGPEDASPAAGDTLIMVKAGVKTRIDIGDLPAGSEDDPIFKSAFPDSLLNAFKFGPDEASPAAGDTLIMVKAGVKTRIDIGDLPAGAEVDPVFDAIFNAHTVVYSVADDTPLALTVGEQTIVGRLTGGNISAITIGIADNNLLQVDQISPADNDFAKFTASGIEGRSFAEVRTDLGLVIGTNVQAWDADLDTYAGITPSANIQTFLGAANYAAMRAQLDLEVGTDFYSVSAADTEFLPRATFADSLLEEMKTGPDEASPAAGDTLIMVKAGVKTRVDVGDLSEFQKDVKIGIGNPNSGQRLEVYEVATAVVRITANTDDAHLWIDSGQDGVGVENSLIRFQADGETKWEMGKYFDNDFKITDLVRGGISFKIADNGDMALMESGGNVGIGTAVPVHSLHIDGGNIALGDTTTGDFDGILYFGDDGDVTAESIRFDDGLDGFLFSSNIIGLIAGTDFYSISAADTEFLPRATFADSLLNAFKFGPEDASPSLGDTLIIIKAGVKTRIDIGDLPAGSEDDPIFKAAFADSLLNAFKFGPEDASPAAGDTLIMVKAGVKTRIDIGDLMGNIGEIQLPAALFDTTAANGSLDFLETGLYRINYWEYAASTQDSLLLQCSIGFSLPQDFGSFIDVYFEYENESTGHDTLILRMEGIAHDEVHAADVTIGSAPDTLVSATGPAANDLRQSTLQSTITGTFTAKDHIHLILYRPATDAGVMRYFKLIFRYLKS